jgi:hypothetical protein
MVEWLLVVILLGGPGAPVPQAISQVGPFKSQAACEAAAKDIRRNASLTRYACVATELAPGPHKPPI